MAENQIDNESSVIDNLDNASDSSCNDDDSSYHDLDDIDDELEELDETTEAEEDESESTPTPGFLRIMRYLMQQGGVVNLSSASASGHIELRRRAGHSDDSISSSSSDEGSSYRGYGSRRLVQETRIPQPPDKPNTKLLDESDLRQQMLYEAGGLHPLHKQITKAFLVTPGALAMREYGVLSKLTNMSKGQMMLASKAYLPTDKNPKALVRGRDKLFCGIHNKEGDLFMSASQDATITIYDTTNGGWKPIKRINCRDIGWSILDIDFSFSGNDIVYSSWSEYVHLCNIHGETDRHEALYLAPDDNYRTAIFSLRFSPDDTEILCGANQGDIYLYNRERKERTMKFQAHEDDLGGICFADDSGHIVYSGGEDGLVNVWDRRCLREDNPIPVGYLAGHYDAITFVDSRGDTRHLITNSKDQSIKLWDIRKFAGKSGIDATKKAVANQQWDYRWHTYSGKYVKKRLPGDCSLMTYYGHSVLKTLIRARFSPPHNTGQQYIYCGDSLGRVVIYEVLTGKIIQILEEPQSRCPMAKKDVIRDVSWHPYDNIIVSSGWDGKLLQWGFNQEKATYQRFHQDDIDMEHHEFAY